MTNYNRLLRKYEKPTPGERYTISYNREIRTQQRIKNRHLILDQLLNETPFHITGDDVERIRYFIDKFPNFKIFHRRVSNECILLAFIFLMKTLHNPKTDVEKYSISKKYGLNNPVFRLIICRLNNEVMKTTPLLLNQNKHKQTSNQYKNETV